MMTTSTVVTVDWSASGRVVVTPHRQSGTEYDREDFMRACRLPAGAMAAVRHAAGPDLVGRVVTLAAVGAVGRAVVVSPVGRRTVCGPVDELSTRAWRGDASWLAAHPAGRVARYAPLGDPRALGQLVGRVFDPRWYVHPVRPDRTSRLESLFGLEPRFDGAARRCRELLVRCWRTGQAGRHGGPADFYGRLEAALLALGRHPHAAQRVCGRHLLKSLVAAWLDAYAAARGYDGDKMFEPHSLFDRTANEALGE